MILFSSSASVVCHSTLPNSQTRKQFPCVHNHYDALANSRSQPPQDPQIVSPSDHKPYILCPFPCRANSRLFTLIMFDSNERTYERQDLWSSPRRLELEREKPSRRRHPPESRRTSLLSDLSLSKVVRVCLLRSACSHYQSQRLWAKEQGFT